MPRFDPRKRGNAETILHAARRCCEPLTREPMDHPQSSRRAFLLGTAAIMLAGCSSTSRTAKLPEPTWRDSHTLPNTNDRLPPAPTTDTTLPGGVIPRSQWALGQPAPALMNAMLPVQYITVHHDGSSAFFDVDEASSKARLESIRRSHRGKDWGDIGYHFAVDRAGRVFQCRPLSWQGAHVKDYNEGNIGVMNLGNFEIQTPTEAQVQGLRRILTMLQRQYNVPVSRVRTHQEWAPTICPGRTMQQYMNTMRASGQLA